MQSLTAPPRDGLTEEQVLASLAWEHSTKIRFGVDLLNSDLQPSGIEVDVTEAAVSWQWRAQPVEGQAPVSAQVRRQGSLKYRHRDGFNPLSVLYRPWVEMQSPELVEDAATGGTTFDQDGFRYHQFTESGVLTVNHDVEVEYLVVAGGGTGGGGGSADGGAGGGAGGVIDDTAALALGSYAVTVGDGGVVPTDNGSDSSIEGIDTATGGGFGARSGVGDHAAGNGGSGGGASPDHTTPGTGVAGQGFDGGGIGAGGTEACGGGGGAGEVGEDSGPNARDPGDGGDGIEWPAGSGDFYGGGGGGSNGNGGGGGIVSSGGLGGGGFGHSGTGDAGDGTANTGGGGGGSRAGAAGDGGSGVVIVRYPLTANVIPAAFVRWHLGVFTATMPPFEYEGLSDADGPLVWRPLELADRSHFWQSDETPDPVTIAQGTDIVQYVKDDLAVRFRENDVSGVVAASPAKTASQDYVFDAGTSWLVIYNTLLAAIGNEPLHTDADGLPRSRLLLDPEKRTAEHDYAFATTVVPQVKVEAVNPDLPNAVRFIAKRSDALAEEGDMIRTVVNDATGPASRTQRGGRTVLIRVEVDAQTQDELDAQARALAPFYFAGGGLRYTGQVGLNPRHDDTDVVFLERLALSISGNWLVTKWGIKLGTADNMRVMDLELEQLTGAAFISLLPVPVGAYGTAAYGTHEYGGPI